MKKTSDETGKDTLDDKAGNPITLSPSPTHYVAVGASAGGLEAIESFFSQMPPESGLGFIVIQHLSPDYKSLMVELLSKRTLMPVHRAEDGMLVLPDHVYLIPPKKNLTIFHGKLLLSEQDHSKGINLPIDVFLRSLAEDQNKKAVAIILSGTGSDGTRGVRVIKEYGGMVMVQDEESAKFDGMPRAAISTGLADFVLPPDQMPSQLLSFSKHPYITKVERSETLLSDEQGLTRIFAILRERCKVDFTFYKPSTVTRRIERRMTVNQTNDIRDYVAFLSSHPGEVMALYRELLIGVTSFFRDQEVFDRLEQTGLPEILKSANNREIRFWVAGCSTGEEAYSLAIMARECMEELDVSHDVKIFATDIDRDAIHYAANGSFPESIAADVSPRLLAKYFYKKEDNFQIARNIREMVVFAQHNLIKDPPFTNISL
jgi:two-component system CheB/CheR fusion protein